MVTLGLLGQQHPLDVGQDAALGDGDFAQQLVQLLVVADNQLQVTRDDAGLLVVPGRVARQLQDLCRQVLQHRRQEHRSAGSTRCIVALSLRPTGNCKPAREDRVLALARVLPPCLPRPDIVTLYNSTEKLVSRKKKKRWMTKGEKKKTF